MLKSIQRWDLEFVQKFSKNPWIHRYEKILKFFTRMGDGWVWGLVIVVLWGVYDFSKFVLFVKYGLMAGVLSLIVYWMVKLSVRRQRPFQMDPNLRPEVPPLDRYSFPSGHTMNNMAVGFSFCWLNWWVGLPLVMVSLSWGILRVYFRVHYLTDILCGALLAILCALFTPFVFMWIPI